MVKKLVCAVLLCTGAWLVWQHAQDGRWLWPLNGRVLNHSAQTIAVWSDDHGYFRVAAHSESDNSLDVDHAFEASSQRWCKIDAHTLVIEKNGRFSNCPCYALAAGRPCITFGQ